MGSWILALAWGLQCSIFLGGLYDEMEFGIVCIQLIVRPESHSTFDLQV